MWNESDQLSRRSIIANMVIDKLDGVNRTSKAFIKSLFLLDIAEISAVVFADSKIEVWKNFVNGVFEMNGGSFNKFVRLVGPGFHILAQHFDLKSDILIEDSKHLDYDFTYKNRTVKVDKSKIKNYRQNKKIIIISENDLFALLKDHENDVKIFFDRIEKADYTKNENISSQSRSINIMPSIFERVFNNLSPFFKNKENILKNILEGKQCNEKLNVPFRQSQFADLFLRLKEKGHLTNNKLEIRNWICKNFNRSDGTSFNETSVYDLLKEKSRISKNSRIFEDLFAENPSEK